MKFGVVGDVFECVVEVYECIVGVVLCELNLSVLDMSLCLYFGIVGGIGIDGVYGCLGGGELFGFDGG